MAFEDEYRRIHDDLRISVTDRCNLRCVYCMPREPVWFPRREILSYEEILRIVRIVLRRGVRKFRITGGEPLVRRDVDDLVRMLAQTPGVEDIALTTNGLLLRPLAGKLANAGLRRVNVSLDTLRPERFDSVTGSEALGRVLDGLDAAAEAGLTPLKINTVLLRGHNDDEVEDLAALARERGWEIRFIEFMPLENGSTWDLDRVVSGAEVKRRIEQCWPLEPDPDGEPSAPANRHLFRDGRGAVGFINSVTQPFCGTCSRIRLTADGRLRVCLYDDEETDLKTPLRNGAGDDDIERLLEEAVRHKGRGGALEILENRAAPSLVRTMHQIGG